MEITLIDFEPQFAADFKRLNLEWLDKYGLTEEGDLKMLNDPVTEIVSTGGVIWLAKAGEEMVGSAALINEGNGVFELAKMAVTAAFQGKGISKLLIEKCLTEAARLGATKVYLVSNSQLGTALSLYEKYGFHHVPATGVHGYTTADVMMEKEM
jgi:putative acetyltransferase